ncbi:MAG: DUF5668 domain-containing protein [Candidatus Acidiferrales bacterium]
MKCAVHPDADATAYCRNCGKALCAECTRSVRGMHYCEPCLAALVTQPPAARASQHSPVAAFFLGLIPGLGAVYNREYTKALIYVAIFVGLVTADSAGSQHVLYSLLISFFVVYMPIEACVTAMHLRDREAYAFPVAAPGQSAGPARSPAPAQSSGFVPTDAPAAEQSPSVLPVAAPADAPASDRRPRLVLPVILIVIGAIFLADNLGWLDADRVVAHGWPLILIALGLWQVLKNRR